MKKQDIRQKYNDAVKLIAQTSFPGLSLKSDAGFRGWKAAHWYRLSVTTRYTCHPRIPYRNERSPQEQRPGTPMILVVKCTVPCCFGGDL